MNNDGFDEFAIGRARELQIYNGRTDLTSAMTPSLSIAGMDLSATGGDFDGNGIGDIAVTGRPIMTSPRSVAPQIYIYSDVASRTIGTTLTLSNADKVIAATGIDRFVPGLTFDASGNDLALLPVSAINRLNSFSMSFWFRTTRVESQVFVSGIRLADGSTQTSAFRIAQFGPNSIQVVVNGVSNIFSMPNYLDGEYHHFTFERSISESTIRVYLDGAIVATWLSVPTAALQPIDVSGGYFAIGNFISDSVFTTNPSLRFEGDMSDFSIWNRSLAQSDVRRINDGLISGSETGLVARYKLDEASGTDLVDSTGINAKGLLGKPNAANSQPSRTSIFVPNRSLPIQPNLDVNADGVSDLLVSASSGAGRISFITGARLPRPIPSSFDVLENWSVAGSGSLVKDSGTGQPTRFDLGGKPYVFSAGSSERWFQFATVGDGKAENLIRLNGPVRMDLLDSKGSVLLTNQTALSMRTMAAGTYYVRVFSPTTSYLRVFSPTTSSIPLGNLFDDSKIARLETAKGSDTFKAVAEGTDLGVSKIQNGGVSTFALDSANQIPFDFTNVGWQTLSNGPPTNDAVAFFPADRGIRTTRATTSVSTTARVEDGIGIHANGMVTFDLNEIRITGGYDSNQQFRFIVDRAGLNDFANVGTIRNMVLVSSANSILSGFVNGQSMPLVNNAGTWSFGGTIPAAQTFSSPFSTYNIDLPNNARYVSVAVSSAGDNHTADHGVFSGIRLVPLAFTIDMTAPKAGQTHEGSNYPDRDVINGGDGNDVLQGNSDLDRLFGGSGADTITGEPVEIRDADGADLVSNNVASSETSYGNSPPVLDPSVGVEVKRIFFDDFELSTLDPSRWPVSGRANVSSSESGIAESSGTRSVRFQGPSTLTSASINLFRTSSGIITYSYEQTGTGESPDPGNDLILEVEDLIPNTWIELERQLGSGPDMAGFVQRRVELPLDALRDNVRFRFLSTGDAPLFDDWFVDDVSVTASFGSPQLQAAIAQGLSDPVTNGFIAGKSAIDFSGIANGFGESARIVVPYPKLHPADFTVEFWANVEGGSGAVAGRTAIYTFLPSQFTGYQVVVTSDNRWTFVTGNQSSIDLLTGPLVTPNQLTHIAASFTKSSGPDVHGVYQGTKSLFVNGRLAAEKLGAYKPQAVTTSGLIIGSSTSTSGFFNGTIDEVRIWSVPRTAFEIEDNYRFTINPSVSGLAACCRLDEGVGSAIRDLAPNPANGTVLGGFFDFQWTGNNFERGTQLHKPLTASRLASLSSLDASNRDLYDLSGAEFLVNVQALNLSGNRLDDSDLSQILPRRLTTGPQAGELVGLPLLESLDLSNNTSITNIGQLVGLPQLNSLLLEGTGVDLAPANTATTLSSFTKLTNLNVPSQILNPGQNVVTVEGQATLIPFQVGVLNLDGVDDFVSTSTAGALGLNSGFTASAWIFPTAEDTVIEPVFGTQTGNGNQGLHLGLRNRIPFMGFFGNDLLGATALPLNQWHHLTWVYARNATTPALSTQTIFVNGVQNGLVRTSGQSNFLSTDVVFIGRAFAGGSAEFFQGSIDGARLFNRALNATEVDSNMLDRIPLTGLDVTANYRFNDGSGTVAVDSSIYNRPGTLVGGASFSNITNVPWALTGAVTTSGSVGPISFTAANQGVAMAAVLGNRFPIVIRNVAPGVVTTPNLGLANSSTGVREGQSISVGLPRVVGSKVEYDVLINGLVVDKYVVNEPGSTDRTNMRAQIQIADPAGQTTDLSYRGSLALNGNSYVDTGYQLSVIPSQRSITLERVMLGA